MKPIAATSMAALLLLASCATQKPFIGMQNLQAPQATVANSPFLERLLQDNRALLGPVIQNPDKYHLQIIYTQINRTERQQPQFTHHYYRLNREYFYPASTVKLPAAVLALEKLNALNIPGLTRHSTLLMDSIVPPEPPAYNDPTSDSGKPSIAHYIKKILLVSDNDAFNRLYAFLGQEAFNQRLQALGFAGAEIIHKLELPLTTEQNRLGNPYRLLDTAGTTLYQQPATYSRWQYEERSEKLGNGYMKNGQLVNTPMDFSRKNRWTLAHQHQFLQWLIFPQTQNRQQRLNLTEADYMFLYAYMSMMPHESRYPWYNRQEYWPTYVKFLLYGSEQQVTPPPNLRIFNKVGDAYGFLIDAAYVADFDKDIEFMLSAVVYCNEDGILNDNRYEYESIGLPFLKNLGQLIYKYEMQRPKAVKPDFSLLKSALAHKTE